MIGNSGKGGAIRAAVGTLIALSFPVVPASAEPQSVRGFAEHCDLADSQSALERIACGDPALRASDATMLGLVSQVEEETAGIDGETGKPSNPVAVEQEKWRSATAKRCRDAACLSDAYDKRIAQIRDRWREALP